MPLAPDALARRVASLVERRKAMRERAHYFTLDFYRRHRGLPPRYVTRLLPPGAIKGIIVRGEVEFALKRLLKRLIILRKMS
jgi:hypothetical protein